MSEITSSRQHLLNCSHLPQDHKVQPHKSWEKPDGRHSPLNTLRLRQNGQHFADDTFKCFFLNENIRILVKISLKFVLKGPINNSPLLVLMMAWHRPGDKPLSEPMMIRLPTHIRVTRPQWVNTLRQKKITPSLQITFSNAISCIKIIVFWLKCQFASKGVIDF